MNRRDFSALGASALALGFPQALPAKSNEAKLQENKNFEFGNEPLVLRLNGKALPVDWLLLATPNGVLGVDTRQPVPVISEKRASTKNVPLIGDLFKQPLTREVVANMPEISPVYHTGKVLITFPDVTLTPRDDVRAAIPIPYPNYVKSFRPANRFKKVKLEQLFTKSDYVNRRPIGTFRLSGKLAVYDFPGVK